MGVACSIPDGRVERPLVVVQRLVGLSFCLLIDGAGGGAVSTRKVCASYPIRVPQQPPTRITAQYTGTSDKYISSRSSGQTLNPDDTAGSTDRQQADHCSVCRTTNELLRAAGTASFQAISMVLPGFISG